MRHDPEEVRSFWRRFIWNRWALALVIGATAVVGFLMARSAYQASNVGVLEQYYRSADEVDR
jgi:hypothetical protein